MIALWQREKRRIDYILQQADQEAYEAAQEVWEWIRAGKLRADIEVIPLKDISSAWERITRLHGSRIVIVP
ncbi:MAG: hypothetical protein KF716_05655 [Anaerolineae bacterium]|nr:hypothetical protein [Anaerolineae bacterium]